MIDQLKELVHNLAAELYILLISGYRFLVFVYRFKSIKSGIMLWRLERAINTDKVYLIDFINILKKANKESIKENGKSFCEGIEKSINDLEEIYDEYDDLKENGFFYIAIDFIGFYINFYDN